MKHILLGGMICSVMVSAGMQENPVNVPGILQNGVRAVVLATVFPHRTFDSLLIEERRRYEQSVQGQLQYVQSLLQSGMPVEKIKRSLDNHMQATIYRDVAATFFFK